MDVLANTFTDAVSNALPNALTNASSNDAKPNASQINASQPNASSNDAKPTLEDSVREYMLVAVSSPEFISALSSKIAAIMEPILKESIVNAYANANTNTNAAANTNTNATANTTTTTGGSKKYASRGRRITRRHRRTSR